MNNGALILKSKNALNDSVMSIDLQSFVSRVEKDGGEIVDLNAVKEAIAFANNNGISSVNDAGIASPRWAIKRENGKVVKLYSLLNSNRDYVVYYRDGNAELNTSYGFNTLKLNPNNYTNIVSREFGYDKSLISLNIHKPLPLSSGEALSSTDNAFNIGNVKRADNAVPTSKGKALIDTYHERASLSSLPSTWDAAYYVRGGEQYMPKDMVGKILSTNRSGFNSSVFYLDNQDYMAVTGGVVNFDAKHNATKPFEGTYFAEYANRGVVSGEASHPLVGDVAEVWTVVGASKETAKALSLRASVLYNA